MLLFGGNLQWSIPKKTHEIGKYFGSNFLCIKYRIKTPWLFLIKIFNDFHE